MFDGKVALVTGGTRGIGAAITAHLARNGARVAAGYSKDKDTAEKLQSELGADTVTLYQGRVDQTDDCERVVREVLDRFGRIDFLINNAGITVDKTVRRMTADDWHNVLNVNLFGAFAMTKAVLEHMIERGSGRIVNISSVIGETGNIGQANYAASKAGLSGFTKSIALEMAQRGITVNCVAPGFIGTEMVAAIPAPVLEKVIEKIPQRRLGTPHEVARVVCFLLEDDSSYITGAVYAVNGGLDMLMIPPEELPYGMAAAGLDPAALGDAVQAVISEALSDPLRMSTLMTQTFAAQQAAGLNLLQRLSGQTVDGNKVGDKRFADPAWGRNPFLLGIAESYLQQSRAALALVESSQLPETTRRKARFALQIMSDALAPTNVPWMNPAVVKEAMETGGASLVRGMQNFMADAQSNGGMPRQVDTSKLTLGANIGATPGRVVFRNDLIELIAYEPQSADVHAIPLVCSPPWINKYYIMDLAPGRSFIEWAVRHGHQTFAISYRNPDETMAGFRMDDYLERGLLAAIERIERITGSKQTNIAALCLGGTLALILLAYMAARGDAHRIGSATLTNSLVDFAEPGDLGVFTDESTIARLEEKMKEHGYLDAAEMAGTFNWMRSNDLIWSYVVNNWFMGKDPPAFDILAWNADSTRLPAAMHSQYLRACYLRNDLVRPGAFTIAGVPIDLGKIQTPLYVLGAEGDHIAPWRSTYRTVNHVGSNDLRYTLTNSGHVAGIANPPGNAKSEHWTKDRALPSESADEWRRTASYHKGTWWEDWATWAAAHAGPRTPPADLPRGDAAPGRYVRNELGMPYDPVPAPAPAPPKRAPKRTPQPRARRKK